jgi:hypothetical protein
MFSGFWWLYGRVGIFVNIQHILSCLFLHTAVNIQYKTRQMHSENFPTTLLKRYHSKRGEIFGSILE